MPKLLMNCLRGLGGMVAASSCVVAAANTLPAARLDLNADRLVSPADAFELRKCLGKAAVCDPRADFDDDGSITVRDLSLLAAGYGRRVPAPTTSIIGSNLAVGASRSVIMPGESVTLRAELRGFADPAARIRWYLPGNVVLEGAVVSQTLSQPGVVPIVVAARLSDGTLVESGLGVTVVEANGQAPASLRLPARPGDVDNSGAVNLVDAYRVFRQVAKVSSSLDRAARQIADIDRDGRLSNLDAEQIALAAISGSRFFESVSPRLVKPGTIVTVRTEALVSSSAELTVQVVGSTVVQRPLFVVPGVASFQVPWDVSPGASAVLLFDGAIERARFPIRVDPSPPPPADAQATVVELLTLIRASLSTNTARVADRALSAGLSAEERATLGSFALAGERLGAVELDVLIRILNGTGGRRAAQVFASALQANGFEDLPALIAVFRAGLAAPLPNRVSSLGQEPTRQGLSAADTACDIALPTFCVLKTIADVLTTSSTVAQVGCTALLAAGGAAIVFPGDGPLIDVATLTLWVASCSKLQVALETAATVAELVGAVDADLGLTASPTSLTVGQNTTLTARLNLAGFDDICSIGGSLTAQQVTEKLADRILGRLLFSNTGVSLVRRAFEVLGGDFLNNFLATLRAATATVISETALDRAVAAAAQALCPSGGLCNPRINTRAALTGPSASLAIAQPNGSALFTCPARTPSTPPSYVFTAKRDFCGDPLESQAEVTCAFGRVTITMGDNGTLLDDIYEVLVNGATVLTSNVPVRSVSVTLELATGRQTVTMLGRAAPDGIGTYFISFSGARLVSGDATSGSDLTPGRMKTFVIEVP